MLISRSLCPAFVFPGQGSQLLGMGERLFRPGSGYERLLRTASLLCGSDIPLALGLLGGSTGQPATDASTPAGPPRESAPDTRSSMSALGTEQTQLSVFALSVALAGELALRGAFPQVVAGHSLGEFSALVAGGWLDVDAGLEFVAARARAMDRCCNGVDGVMVAVVGFSPAAVDDLVRTVPEPVAVANRNSPKQVVLSGTGVAVQRVARAALAAGASAAVDLPVAGAFHSPLMRPAQDALAPLVERLPLRVGRIPLISSMDGRPVRDLGRYRAALLQQVCAPVEWMAVMQTLRDRGVDLVVEVGPGRVLRGLLRHLDRRWATTGCEDAAELPNLIDRLPSRPLVGGQDAPAALLAS